MIFETDLTQVTSKYDRIPEGVYIFRLLKTEKKLASSGKEALFCDVQILEPSEFAQKQPEWAFVLSLSEGALFMVKGLYEATGKLKPGPWNPMDLWGCEFGAIVAHREYNDEIRANIARFLPLAETKPGLKETAI